MSRYTVSRVNYPPNSTPLFENLFDIDSSVSMQNNRKDSVEDDFIVEGECVVYTTNKTLFAIDIKEPTYVSH